ncbi:MAG: alanine glycine permease [Opitutaceae bacterium]|nr:alanine glycine permease [Opitutaceae bacterium]
MVNLSRFFGILLLFSFLLIDPALVAQDLVPPIDLPGVEQSLDDQINDAIGPATRLIENIVFFSLPIAGQSVPLVLIWLVVGALVFTIYFRFINIRGFKLAIDIVRGKYTKPDESGEVSHFQALTAALSGTVGLGNIAGVAVAISLGGPGATFWMIVAGLLGMTSKLTECTLGVKYRQLDEDGRTYGGPMYYLSQGFAEKGWVGLGKFLAIFFAIMCIGGSIGGGNMFQINQAYSQFVDVTGGDTSWWAGKGWLFGLIIAFIVGMVIIGGIRSIARTTAKIVPFMCGIYVAAAIVILVTNIGQVPSAFGQIIIGAFTSSAVAGGVIGVIIQGFRRAAFSNEAGIGSASIAHSAVRTENPASEGLVSLLEPFIDTVVVCTMTALVIIITGTWANTDDLGGVGVTSAAFESVITWFPLILAIAVILFAFSTMIAWSYYGEQSWVYLFGRSERSKLAFKLLFCGFVVIGAAMSLGNVIGFSDAMIFAMCFPNVIGLYVLMPKARRELESYMKKIEDGTIQRYDADSG